MRRLAVLLLVLGFVAAPYVDHFVSSAPARHAVATAAQPGLPMWDGTRAIV
jgi:hypothetical protein